MSSSEFAWISNEARLGWFTVIPALSYYQMWLTAEVVVRLLRTFMLGLKVWLNQSQSDYSIAYRYHHFFSDLLCYAILMSFLPANSVTLILNLYEFNY